MDTGDYAITLFFLTIFMLLYGGISNYDKIEYNTKAIANINHIKIFKGYAIRESLKFNVSNNKIFDVTDDLKVANTFLPNIIKIFLLRINPNQIINLPSIKNETTQSCYMIIYNFKQTNNNMLELLVSNNNNSLDNSQNNSLGNFYGLSKQISLTNIFPFYNSSSKNVDILVIVLKRPFWNYYF